jgi:hypothetical protein
LEDFVDSVGDQKTFVKAGERKILVPSLVFKRRRLPPMVKEHTYELKMEKKLTRMLEKEEKRTEPKQAH